VTIERNLIMWNEKRAIEAINKINDYYVSCGEKPKYTGVFRRYKNILSNGYMISIEEVNSEGYKYSVEWMEKNALPMLEELAEIATESEERGQIRDLVNKSEICEKPEFFQEDGKEMVFLQVNGKTECMEIEEARELLTY